MASSRLLRLITTALLGLTLGTASCATTVPPASRSPSVGPPRTPHQPTIRRALSHTAALLHDGRVLLMGGGSAVGELYDPNTHAWTPINPMPFSASSFRAFALVDGRVFVYGRDGVKLFDPTTDTWADPSPPQARAYGATLLSDGRVLATPGSPPNERRPPAAEDRFVVDAETYDPLTDRWAPAGEMHWETWPPPRGSGPSSVTRLLDGRVLAVYSKAAELYDPTTNSWSEAAALPERASGHGAALLPNGDVLVVGGTRSTGPTPNTPNISRRAYRYVPSRDAWVRAPDMRAQRRGLKITPLPNGQVLVWGGDSGAGRGMEIYSPPPAEAWYTAADMPILSPFDTTATVLNTGHVLFVGSRAASHSPRPEVQHAAVYDPQSDQWR